MSLSAPENAEEYDEKFPLHHECKRGSVSITELQAIAENDEQTLLDRDEEGQTPLHVLLYSHEGQCLLDQIKLLVSAGAASIADNEGSLPLHIACVYGASVEVLELLTEESADHFLAQNNQGFTPLHMRLMCQTQKYDSEALKLLMSNGATSLTDNKGRLPLHIACMYDAPFHALQALAEKNMDALLVQDNENGWTPLHQFLRWRNEGCNLQAVDLLTSTGAASIADKYGRLPLYLANERGASDDVLRALSKCSK
mmetsp:Transcript_40780/g.49652  ORF Transcript_40780/g.49652 Transcript_40780/m.49652 type:complete len:255 (-) Transcript_40780:360-1124(-)|eukprot:CAMPEP_0172502816 /NCGR_PEP_ID=MMETSP1066-20121228/162952_1 /TAXON_ID=671091 /ORGANISM="Coscinodiscus wailesii, Strain CCMP2513" /LENGTH=254 /DNA_ID=CAMNT_0013278205 /DNA_START=175 /DNA_END=939 /DNA_ORIENTATION=+